VEARRDIGRAAPLALLVAGLAAACAPGSRYASSRSGQTDPSGAAGQGPSCAPAASDAGACARSQPVLACDVTNARDLGGLPLSSGGSVACGALLRGPPLADLSKEGCDEAARLGIRTIVDLRTPGERSSRPNDTCVTAKRVLAPLPIPYGVSPTDYLADFDTKDSMALVFRTLGDPAAYPIYFHCTYGRDRTGVVAAATLLALGVSREDIMREYMLSKQSVGAYPDSLTAVLDEVERRGGIDAALRASGVTDADLAGLRARVAVAP
jgi:protein-tyrosine phosphatase